MCHERQTAVIVGQRLVISGFLVKALGDGCEAASLAALACAIIATRRHFVQCAGLASSMVTGTARSSVCPTGEVPTTF